LLLAALLIARSPRWTIAPFAIVIAACYAPFVEVGSWGEAAGLSEFARSWEFNSLVYALLAPVVGTLAAKAVGLVAIAAVWIAVYRRMTAKPGESSAGLPRADWLYALAFLSAPVINPWYLLWLLPFVCIWPSVWGVAAMAAVSVCYAHGLFLPDSGLPPYHHPVWVRPLEISIVLGAVVLARLRGAGAPTAA
jgi:alpha-1,6-mannosyltransferase